MNKHQVKGAAREAAGRAQKAVGKATGNRTQAMKGAVREAAGKTQKAYGNAKEGSKASTRRVKDRSIDRHAY